MRQDTTRKISRGLKRDLTILFVLYIAYNLFECHTYAVEFSPVEDTAAELDTLFVVDGVCQVGDKSFDVGDV